MRSIGTLRAAHYESSGNLAQSCDLLKNPRADTDAMLDRGARLAMDPRSDADLIDGDEPFPVAPEMTSLRHGIHTAGKQRTETRVRTILDLVRDEYNEMPDMALSLEQACTLWNAEPPVVARALDALVAEGYLHVSRNRYVRAR